MKKAIFIKEMDWLGDARMYKLGDSYVIVSAVVAPYSGPETYAFACDSEGEVTDWLELDASICGELNHEAVLNNFGYMDE